MIIDGNIKLDWLSFTLKRSEEGMEKVLNFFDIETDKDLPRGGMGYEFSADLGNGGRMFWSDARVDMGIHVSLPSGALSGLKTTAIGLLRRVFDWEGTISRIDIAFDDLDGALDMDTMHASLEKGMVVTRWKKLTRISGSEVGNDTSTGDTINVGSRASESFLRIYDKVLEMQSKGEDVADLSHWVRVELEMKGDKADAFSRVLSDEALKTDGKEAQVCAEILYGLIDFKADRLGADTNKSRWETAQWWLDFIQVTSKSRLCLPKTTKTLDESKRWFQVSISSTLAMIMLSRMDDDGQSGYDFIMNCARIGQYRMSKEQKERLSAYNGENGAITTSGTQAVRGRAE